MIKKQAKLTSLWADSDDDNDCMIIDPLPNTCSTTKKPANVSIVNVSSTKKPSQWVASAFDGFDDFTASASQTKNKPPAGGKTTSTQAKEPGAKRSFEQMMTVGKGKTAKNTVSRRANTLPETNMWSEKYAPSTQADLAVHKKKIGEVEQWLEEHLRHKKLPPILLLTGPAGVGKTATVRVLAKQFNFELHEWANPLAGDQFDGGMQNNDWKSRGRLEASISSSQVSQFQEFLLRANKYNTLDIFGGSGGVASRRLVMVEDFPNIFYRDAEPFHEILRRFSQTGGSPLVFIVSDSTSGESTERLLFPKDVQSRLHITNISFNPVAMTSMTKILTKIATDESQKGSHMFTVPSKSVIESIAMASAGDIRGAINAMQFACLKDTCDLASAMDNRKPKQPIKKTGSNASVKRATGVKRSLSKTSSFQKEEELLAIGGRDTSLFLFRALGKILYCKRDEPSSDMTQLPPHLAHCYRDPLQVDPEEVVEKCHLSGDYFSCYLHQNYTEFFSYVDDIVLASEYLSDSDFLTMDWASRSALQQYAASVATRGIIFCNSCRARHTDPGGGMGWKPLHKPQWYTTSKQAKQNCETARYLFRSYRSSPVVLQTELIPYISLINTTLHDTGQIAFMQEICRFSNQRKYEKLDEKDVDISDDDDTSDVTKSATNQIQGPSMLPTETDDVISSSQSNVKSSQAEEEEDFVIEDYDDD